MSKIIVQGGNRLTGAVKVSGAKNAVLPIMAGCLLTPEECRINEVPYLEDVSVITDVLRSLGARVNIAREGSIDIYSDNIGSIEAPYELVRRMRASFLVMGPLLARTGNVKMSMPGGCAIGSRPIDLHLKGFMALGANINCGHGYIEASAKKLTGNRIYLDFPSVGATENIMMAATLASGTTILENAAQEPEIVDLANFLNGMGAKVRGAGTNIIKIEGVQKLSGIEYTVIPDRIEAGTFMAAAAITLGDIIIENAISDHLKPVIAKLREAGVEVIETSQGIRVKADRRPKSVDIKTMPYPGFPTDMQAQMMALMSIADGVSIIIESVFENRFMHIDELKRMGARIKIEGRSAVVEGIPVLSGARVKATDLRAGASLIIAGLAAEGKTFIDNVYHIDRGYSGIEKKLKALGADIERFKT